MTQALGAIRRHLGMEIAYVSEFVRDKSIYRHVDAPGYEDLIKPGDSRPLADVYCRHILAGELPELITDTRDFPLAMSKAITKAAPIGSHISVPIQGPDGEALGMFCCLSPTPNRALDQRDLQAMHVFADILGHQIAGEISAHRETRARAEAVAAVIEQSSFKCVYQPIWDLRILRPVGVEALCRFLPQPTRPPNEWFADAFATGQGVDLDLGVVDIALRAASVLPPSIDLSINVAVQTILSGRLPEALQGVPADRLLLEITEHDVVEDYDAFIEALAPLRQSGLRIAIDDAGAGFSTLQHILSLNPERIKLDMSLTRSVDSDPARRALVAAMTAFSRETGATLIAEGIETRAECDTLTSLGVAGGQGYFLGRPDDLDQVLGMFSYQNLDA